MRTVLILVVSIALALPLAAAELAGIALDDSVTVGGESLVLNGLGLRKKYFVKVYVGGLYLPAKESDPAKVLAADSPRRIVMGFVHKVTKDQLCEGWEEGLANNTPSASAEVKADFDTLCGYMEDVAVNDSVTFTYVPGTGTEVAVRGTAKGTIEGKGFADALLNCWLGPEPPSGGVKEGMLGTE